MSIMRSAGIKSTLASFVEVVLFFCVLSVIYFVLSYVVYAAIAMPRARAHTAEALAASQAGTLKAETELNEAIQSEIDDLAAVDAAQLAFDQATAPLYDDPAFAELLATRDAAQLALEADGEDLALQAAYTAAQIALDEAPKPEAIQATYDEAKTALGQAQSQARSAGRWRKDRLDNAIKTATECALLMLTEAVEDASDLLEQSNEASAASDRITGRMDRFIALAAPDPIEAPAEEAPVAEAVEEDATDEAEEVLEELTPEQLAAQEAQAAQEARAARLAKAQPLTETMGSSYGHLLAATVELNDARTAFQKNATACNDALTEIVTTNEDIALKALDPTAEAEAEADNADVPADDGVATIVTPDEADTPAPADDTLAPFAPWAQEMTDQFLRDRNAAQLILTNSLPDLTQEAQATRDQAQRVLALAKEAVAGVETSPWAKTLIDPNDQDLLAQMAETGEALRAVIGKTDESIAPRIQSALQETRELLRQQEIDPTTGELVTTADAEQIRSAWLRGDELAAISAALAPVEAAMTDTNEFLTRLQAYCATPTNRPVCLSDALPAASLEQLEVANGLMMTLDDQLETDDAINPIVLDMLLEELSTLADRILLDADDGKTALVEHRKAVIAEAVSMTNSIQDDAKRIIRYCNASLNTTELAALPLVHPGQSRGQSFSQGLQQMRLGGLFSNQAPYFRLGRVFAAMPWWLWIVFGGLYIVFLMIYWAPSDDPAANICEVRAFVLFGLLAVALMLIRAEIQSQRVSHSVKLFFKLLT